MDAFKLCIAKDRHSKHWQEKTLSMSDLGDLFIGGHAPRDSKDGLCFVSATLLDGKRNLKSVNEVYLLVYDIDGAQSLDEVREIVGAADVTAFVYTTYSHKSTRTYILTDHYEKWAKQAKVPTTPSLNNLKQYLEAKGKSHLSNIKWDDVNGAWERVADIGNCYVVDHDPVDKIRVVFPLDKPIVVSKLGSTNAKCNDAYKAIYHGVGQKFNFDFDPSCSDPTRLFYFPSCPADKLAIAFYREYEGAFLDWTSVPRVTVSTKKTLEAAADGQTGIDKPKRTEDYMVYDHEGRRINLWTWYANNRQFDYDIEGLIEQCLPDQILAPRSNGGHTITCPFEAEHSDVGGTGTFACNADGQNPWTIYCSHASCRSEDRKKLDCLKEWITQGLLFARDIYTDKETEELEQTAKDDHRAAAEDMDLEADVLPAPEMISQPLPETAPQAEPISAEVREDPVKFTSAVMERLSEMSFQTHMTALLEDVAIYNAKNDDNKLILTDDMYIEQLSKTTARISIRDLKRGARSRVSNIDELAERIVAARAESSPYEPAIGHIIDMSYSGLRLQQELERLAGWYNQRANIVRADYKRQVRDSRMQTLDVKLREHFPKLTTQYAKLVHGSKVEILDEVRTRSTGKLKTLTMEGFHNLMGNEVVEINEKDGKGNIVTKSVPVSKAWTSGDRDIRVFTDVTFDPGQPSPTSNNEYNLWSGFPIKAIKLSDAQRKEVEDRAIRHIREVWCDGDEGLTQWVVMFFADLFQRPWSKPQCAICIMGGQGTGKSIILDCGLKPVLRTMYIATSERDQLVGKFNRHAEGKLLWLAEESLFSGDLNSMNKLKDLISRDTISIEPKTKDVYEVPNRVRYIFTSNQLHPLNLEQDDRRFLVLGASDIHKQDIKYNSALKDWCLDGGARLFMSYLMEWKFNETNKQFFPEWEGDAHGEHCTGWRQLFKTPNTRYKDSQKKQSLKAADDFFIEMLTYGRIVSLPDHLLMEQPRTFWWPYQIDIDTPTVGGPESSHKNSNGTLWLKMSKTDIRNLFNAYVRHFDASGMRWSRNQFGDLWDKYFGRAEDSRDVGYNAPKGAANPGNPKQWGLCFWPRRIAVNRAHDRQLIDDEAKTIAELNYDSHVANEQADKDHK